MKRFLAIALSVAMILVVFLMAGCGPKTPTDQTTAATTPQSTTAANGSDETTAASGSDETTAASGVEDTTEGTTAPPVVVDPWESWDGLTKAPGFEDVDFRGKTFTIATCNGPDDRWISSKEIYSEEADPISVAVRNRNKAVETLYNCTIVSNASENPGSLVNAEVTSNKHTIDMYSLEYHPLRPATSGNNYNLYTLGIDFSNDWWDQKFVSAYTIKNANGADTMYSMVGDFALSSFAATHAIMFSKKLMESSNITDNVYELVREGKWTMDKFVEMIKAAAVDSNGNSEFKSADGDTMGWLRTAHAAHAMHVASTLSIMSNVNGSLVFNVSENSAQWTDIVDKAIEIWGTAGSESTGYTAIQTALQDGTVLFGSEVIDVLERMKDADATIGLIPYPKYSESQEGYAHYVDSHLFYYCVPVSVSETLELGKFIELFTAHSRYIVRSAWIDTYCYEYCGDADSAEMLNIILNSRTYDPGYLQWFTYEAGISQQIDSGKNNITRWADRNAASIAQDLTTFMNNLNTKNKS